MSQRRFLAVALLIIALGGALRMLWLRADPPTTSVGIVWHDEGAWTHNARNRALWGTWTTDQWNPVYIAPVFTAFEYAAFRAWGVGTWQARTIPAASGLVALAAIMMGLAAVTGHRRVALVGGVLLATEYTWVMWNRAALMESTMTMFMVMAWAAYALASKRPVWGLLAGAAAALAWFTKAAAAFFVAAIVVDAAITLLARPSSEVSPDDIRRRRRAALWTLAGGAVVGGAIALVFVWPHWTDYWFYNVQMSVERKPTYDLPHLIERASWLPVVQDIFTRLWPLLAASAIAMAGVFARLRQARPGERLLVWWVVFGLAELVVHDSGSERRYVMFIPAIVALASLALASGAAWIPSATAAAARWRSRLLFVPVALGLGYVVIGSALQPLLVVDRSALHPYHTAVSVAAALAVLGTSCLIVWWRPAVGWLSTHAIPPRAAAVLVAAVVLWNLGQYVGWAAARTELNYRASVALGQLLPSGTPVQGKLANGLDLENQIKPIFVGRGFGNYADRFDRDDARYILTYDLPKLGFESQPGLIDEILARYPNKRPVATFDVEETTGADRAVLIEKRARD
jgi:4-amino-4-deoxy-L-arabinose transferase-like glycosyltransferase